MCNISVGRTRNVVISCKFVVTTSVNAPDECGMSFICQRVNSYELRVWTVACGIGPSLRHWAAARCTVIAPNDVLYSVNKYNNARNFGHCRQKQNKFEHKLLKSYLVLYSALEVFTRSYRSS